MTDNVTNFLASGIEIKGTIRFQNDMHIDGKIEGEIISDKGKVTIGETAQIKGDITAGDVRIYGNVEGKVTSDRCELKQQARVVGDMKTRSLAMEEGAHLLAARKRLKNSRPVLPWRALYGPLPPKRKSTPGFLRGRRK